MIKGLGGCTIWSEDLNNLLPFYRDTLGFAEDRESEDFVLLGPEGGPVLALGTHSDVKGRNSDPARHIVMLTTDDIEGDFERLKAQGVKFVEDRIETFEQVRAATFEDPEGNYLQLLQFV